MNTKMTRRAHNNYISRLPRNDVPRGTYNATNTARFVDTYHTIARGFYEALHIRSLRIALWLCPNCDELNRNKDINDLSGESINYCEHCERRFTYNNILLGQAQ